MFGECLLLWVSRFQMEIALLTREAEYIVLSQSMHNLLATHCLIEDVLKTLSIKLTEGLTHSTEFEDNKGAILLASAQK